MVRLRNEKIQEEIKKVESEKKGKQTLYRIENVRVCLLGRL